MVYFFQNLNIKNLDFETELENKKFGQSFIISVSNEYLHNSKPKDIIEDLMAKVISPKL